MEVYKLKTPLVFEGKTYKKIELDFESLSVTDLEKCERIARTFMGKKESLTMPDTNRKYQAVVAARASGLPVEAIRSLSGRDYVQVCLEVLNFYMGGDLEEDEEDEETMEAPAPDKSGKTQTSSTMVTTASTGQDLKTPD